MSTTFPVLPRYLRDDLGSSDSMIGLVLGSMAVGAIAARPVLGLIGDRLGRGVLVVGGALLSALAMAGHLVADTELLVAAFRVLFGVGQGGLIVGATTLAVDLAPSDRAGEGTSYIFVALHLGSGAGPVLGEWLLDQWSFDAVWAVAAAGMTASAVVGAGIGARDAEVEHQTVLDRGHRQRLLHPQAVLPGLVLGIGIVGFIGFNAFVPLYGDEIGIDNTAPYFLASSLTIVLIRALGAKLPDRLGPVRGGTVALSLMVVGLAVIGGFRSSGGLATGTVVLAAGTALLLPSLVGAAVAGVPATQRSAAMATYTLFLDLSGAVGAAVFGGVASISSYGTAYLVGAGSAAGALVLLRSTRRSFGDTAAAP